MLHDKIVKVTIDTMGLAEIILDMIVWHYGLPTSIMSNRGSLFISKFSLYFYYFFNI